MNQRRKIFDDNTPEQDISGQETSGHDVQKQEQEKQVADVPNPYPVENARHNYATENGNPQSLRFTVAMADKPMQKISLKEKLEAFKVQAGRTSLLKTGKFRSIWNFFKTTKITGWFGIVQENKE